MIIFTAGDETGGLVHPNKNQFYTGQELNVKRKCLSS